MGIPYHILSPYKYHIFIPYYIFIPLLYFYPRSLSFVFQAYCGVQSWALFLCLPSRSGQNWTSEFPKIVPLDVVDGPVSPVTPFGQKTFTEDKHAKVHPLNQQSSKTIQVKPSSPMKRSSSIGSRASQIFKLFDKVVYLAIQQKALALKYNLGTRCKPLPVVLISTFSDLLFFSGTQ